MVWYIKAVIRKKHGIWILKELQVFFATVSAVLFSVQEISGQELSLSRVALSNTMIWHYSLNLIWCCDKILLVLVVPGQFEVYGTDLLSVYRMHPENVCSTLISLEVLPAEW